MKTIKDVEKEFDEKFCNTDGTLHSEGDVDFIKSFISASLRELLEQVVPEEKHTRCEWCESFSECDCKEYNHAFNYCRQKVLNNIKKIIE